MEELGKILPLVFKAQMRRHDARVVQILAPLWRRVAGKAMAQHSKPVRFANGMLTIESDCPNWSAEMSRMAERIQTRINAYLGEPMVRKLQVRYVPDPLVSDVPARPQGRMHRWH